jgi:hypothetical protein
VALDEVRLQDEGFFFGAGEDDFDVGDPAHQRIDLGIGMRRRFEIGRQAFAQAAGLADIKDPTVDSLHQVDTGFGGGIRGLLRGIGGRRLLGFQGGIHVSSTINRCKLFT